MIRPIASPQTPRTRRVLIGGGMLLTAKLFGLASLLVLTGLASRYLSSTDFGLWSILTNLPLLAATFDLGLGNTLRNKMAVLSADRDQDQVARLHFFVGVWTFGLMAFGLIGILLVYKNHLPWHWLFALSPSMTGSSWTNACALSLGAMALCFPFSLGAFGFYAYQETHWTAVFETLKGVAVCALVAIAIAWQASFLVLISVFFGSLLLTTMGSWAYFLIRRGWTPLIPSWSQMIGILSELGPKSIQFSVLQMSAGIILLTDVMLVGWVCGLEQAGNYALVQRLYTFLIAAESLMLTPLWSAYTEAHAQREKQWVVVQLKRSVALTLGLIVIGGGIVFLFGPWMIHAWTHKWIVARSLFGAMVVWTAVHAISHCFSVYLNAVGRLKRQTVLAGVAAIVNIPLALWLGKQWGPAGVCWAGVFCILPSMINNPFEVIGFLRTQKQSASL